uniref:Uncharacterized protein n=1 Tax=viral metagenome TaxID=1070528 RepID=A0A6M3X6A8_9ZZZZ
MYIKKTNVIETRTVDRVLRKVQCPYCKTLLETVPEYITAMICWNRQCSKEFRIEQDPMKIVDSTLPSVSGKAGRTVLRGVIK